MGLLDVFRGKPRRMIVPVDVTRKKAPRKRRSSLEIAIDRRTLELQKENPALFDKIVLRKAGLGADGEPGELPKFLAMQEQVDQHYEKRRGDNGESSGSWVKDFGQGIGRALGQMAMVYVRQQQGGAADAPAQPQQPVAQLPPGHTPPPASEGD